MPRTPEVHIRTWNDMDIKKERRLEVGSVQTEHIMQCSLRVSHRAGTDTSTVRSVV
jgi:hypothetical protein